MTDTTSTADKEFQTGIRAASQEALVKAVEVIVRALNSENPDPEYALKATRELKNIAGAEPEKKVDPNAGLATFNIIFSNGSAQVTAAPAPLVEVVQEVQPARPLDDLPTLSVEVAKPKKRVRQAKQPPPVDDELAGFLSGV